MVICVRETCLKERLQGMRMGRETADGGIVDGGGGGWQWTCDIWMCVQIDAWAMMAY